MNIKKNATKNVKKFLLVSITSLLLTGYSTTPHIYASKLSTESSKSDVSTYKSYTDQEISEISKMLAEEFVEQVKPNDLYPAIPAYVGWQDDLHNGMIFWHKTKTGKCISNIFNPSRIIKDFIKNRGKELISGKISKKTFTKELTLKGVKAHVAVEVIDCIISNWMK